MTDLIVDDLDIDLTEEDDGLPPEEPSLSPGEWLKKNLFSSPANTVITLLTTLFIYWVVRSLLGFVVHPERRWDAVATNTRSFMTQGYPKGQFSRIWVSLGFGLVLTGLSAAVFRTDSRVSMKRISIWLMGAGAAITAAVLLAPVNPEGVDEEGEPWPTRSFGEALGDRSVWLIIGLVSLAAGLAIWYGMGERRRSVFVPAIGLIFGVLGGAIATLWFVPYGHYAFYRDAEGEEVFLAEAGRTVAHSTQLPWTVMWLLLVGSFIVGLAIRDRLPGNSGKVTLSVLWLLAPFLAYWVIQRDPAFDWGHVWSTDVPIFLGFALLGGAALYALTSQGIGETGRIMAAVLVAFGVFNWVAAFFDLYPFNVLQKVRISFLLLGLVALAAPNFAGARSTRIRFVGGWVALMAVLHYLITVFNTPSTLDGIQTENFQGGFNLTIFVASLTMILSFPLGVLLALARTSTMPIFRVLATSYIELVRGVPLITLLFFASNVLPLFLPGGMDVTELAAVTAAYSLFSAAYLAENIRGGLQSIRRGQFEAADAIGLTTTQRTGFIVLPQALRVSIPPLVGQTIATFKETSLLFIIGLNDLLRVGNNIIPQQTAFQGVRKEGLLFVCVIYWIGSFAMSKYSQKLERRLGVGER